MTVHTHHQQPDHHEDGTTTTSATSSGLALRPAGYQVGDRVRVEPGAVPAAWVPPTGVRLTDRTQHLVGTVVEAHRGDGETPGPTCTRSPA